MINTKVRCISFLMCLCLLFGLMTGCSSGKKEEAGASPEESQTQEESVDETTTEEEPSVGETEEAPIDATSDETSDETLNEPEESEEPLNYTDTTTVMVYMTGSDLEASIGAGTNDLVEIRDSGVNLDYTTVLVYTGGSPMWHYEGLEIPTDQNMIYQLTADGFQPVAALEPLSMGEPESLTRFIDFGYENYQTDTYDLILWDHGNGPLIGYGLDKQYGNDSLTLPEIREALEQSVITKNQKLAVIGFDACLMASAELCATVRPYADYLVASQETEPGFGWNYAFLKQCGARSTEELLRVIIDEYLSYNEAYCQENNYSNNEVTLSAVDLAATEALDEQIDALFSKATEDVSGAYNKLAVGRVKTRAFGRATTGSEYDLVDLNSLMEEMQEAYPEETQAIQKTIEEAVLYSGATMEHCCGLSLYYPYYNKRYYEAAWKEDYEALEVFPGYTSYLDRFDKVWLGTELKELFQDQLIPQEGTEGNTYTLQLTEAQQEVYAGSGYYILQKEGEGVYNMIYFSRNVTEERGLLTAHFSGDVIYYKTKFGEKGIPLIQERDTVDGTTYYSAFPSLQKEEDHQSCELQFEVTGDEIKINGIYADTSEEEMTTGKRPQVDLSQWVWMNFYRLKSRYLTRDEQGTILDFWEWPETTWISWNEVAIVDDIDFTFEPLYDDGSEYFLMFQVRDTQGNKYSSELLPVTLKEAPPEDESIPERTISWTDPESVMLIDEQGVQVELSCSKDPFVDCSQYYLDIRNDNDFSIYIKLDNVTLNDSVLVEESIYAFLDPHESERTTIKDLPLDLVRMDQRQPESLSCQVRLRSWDTGGTMIPWTKYRISVDTEIDDSVRILPYMKASAKEQQLLDEEELVITLRESGYIKQKELMEGRYAFCSLPLVIENKGKEKLDLDILGVLVNDIMIDRIAYLSVDPGVKLYKNIAFQTYQILDAGISEIESMELVVEMNDQISILPITLETKGSQNLLEEITAEEPLYTDEQLEVYAGRKYVEDDYTHWIVYIKNLRQENIAVVMQHEAFTIDGIPQEHVVTSFIGSVLPPGQYTACELEIQGDYEKSDLCFKIMSGIGTNVFYAEEQTLTEEILWGGDR